MTHRVLAIRTGGWWAIEFPDLDRRMHSQARRLEQVPAMAADAIAVWHGNGGPVDPATIEVVPVLAGDFDALVGAARQHRADAETAAEAARQAMIDVAAQARADGLTARDLGHLLGVSHQYAARLMAATAAA